jgi:hypothetical protein
MCAAITYAKKHLDTCVSEKGYSGVEIIEAHGDDDVS